jgi:hypothetical protein
VLRGELQHPLVAAGHRPSGPGSRFYTLSAMLAWVNASLDALQVLTESARRQLGLSSPSGFTLRIA